MHGDIVKNFSNIFLEQGLRMYHIKVLATSGKLES